MEKTIHISETAGIARDREHVQVSVPWARGELREDAQLTILGPTGQMLPCQNRVLKMWPDGSVKWGLVDFFASVSAHSGSDWRLLAKEDALQVPAAIAVVKGQDCWQVDTGSGVFHLDTITFRPFKAVRGPSGDLLAPGGGGCQLCLDNAALCPSQIEEISLEESGPLHAVVRLVGTFATPSRPWPRFICRLHFFAGSMTVKFEMTLHNPRAAMHPKGLWDLGDEGSLFFKELTFSFSLLPGEAKEVCCVPEPGAERLVLAGNQGLSIYQESSGGENWQSPNHRNRQGRVPMTRRGYVVEGEAGEIAAGLRALPLVWCGEKEQGVAAALPRFWQEFPKQIEASGDQLKVALFPGCFPDLHELQGGEQKTNEFVVDFAAAPDSLARVLKPLEVIVSPAVYRESGIISDLPGEKDLVDRFTTIEDMLAKREQIDEFGWRHFGEVYADHEAALHEGENPFVSNYNNQYDLVAGVYRKAFASGDPGWLEFADELAKHVRDIDLYHTEGDREEYNQGLFWHTDHYADAGLSTHRSYSREQKAAYEMHAGGGGPGAEHCYASGLALHYFRTGNPDFKEAVIRLAEWELLALNGPQTVLAAAKRLVDNMRFWRSAAGESRLFPAYPFTRGTGNAITTCLDAFEVSGDRVWLERVADILKRTLHPADDVGSRDLLNAEIGWSYTVLLGAVAKYLDKKSELGEFDASFHHARLSMLHYADWMAENEYPYLDKPEILEYPNETWAAQELRKSVVFYQAARYSSQQQQQELFLHKARLFYDYACKELPRHAGSRFTRPVALMLQNGWIGSKLAAEDFTPASCPESAESEYLRMHHLGLGAVMKRFVWDLGRVIKGTSVRRELAWLKARLR